MYIVRADILSAPKQITISEQERNQQQQYCCLAAAQLARRKRL
jgi:hypothetical protein